MKIVTGMEKSFRCNVIEAQAIGSGTTATSAQKQYSPAHAGWVGITTYTDTHGNVRVKTETFVAGSTITGDAADDTKLPDSV